MTEEILEPELPIIDPHHHLWDLRPLVPAFPEPRHAFIEAIAGAAYYTFDELHADTHSGHNVVGTVFMECGALPYLPIDPADLGRSYEAVIRVNSQSGKGGFAWVLEQDQGLKLPKKMQADFSPHVQRMADAVGRELNAADIWEAFKGAYHVQTTDKHFQLVDYEERRGSDGTRLFTGTIAVEGREQTVSGRIVGPVEDFL